MSGFWSSTKPISSLKTVKTTIWSWNYTKKFPKLPNLFKYSAFEWRKRKRNFFHELLLILIELLCYCISGSYVLSNSSWSTNQRTVRSDLQISNLGRSQRQRHCSWGNPKEFEFVFCSKTISRKWRSKFITTTDSSSCSSFCRSFQWSIMEKSWQEIHDWQNSRKRFEFLKKQTKQH